MSAIVDVPGRPAPSTDAPLGKVRALQLSVVIPARNEERHIGPVLERVLGGSTHEVIVVDGESTDGTGEIARSLGARVVSSPPGRGRQMNAGAAAATGDRFLFLHADTLLPRNFDRFVSGILSRSGIVAGAFRLTIDAPQRSFRFIEKLVDWRSRVLQIPYGDQTLFLTAEIFRRVGGFGELPAMEDYELVRRLRRLGRIEIAKAAVRTSPRGWLEGGIWRTTLFNQVCIAAYSLGVSPGRIAAWRRATREHGTRIRDDHDSVPTGLADEVT